MKRITFSIVAIMLLTGYIPTSVGLAIAANPTFKAYWDNGGNADPDIADHMAGFINNASAWETDGEDNGHMNLRGELGTGERVKPWSNNERMRATLSAAGGTIMFWFKPEETGGTFEGLLCGWEDWDDNFYGGHPLNIEGSFGGDTVGFYLADSSLGAAHVHTESFTLSNDTWYHMAFVFDLNADVSRIYLNGVQIGSDAGLGNQSAFDPMLTYGNEGRFVIAGKHAPWQPGPDISGEGDYDQFEIYNVALSSGEVAANYALGRVYMVLITSLSELPRGTTGVSYSQALQVTGGTPPYEWGIVLGALPDGLGLGLNTGETSGVPAATGIFDFTVQASDTLGQTSGKQFTIQIVSLETAVTPGVGVFRTTSSDNTYILYESGAMQGENWEECFSSAEGIDDIYFWFDEGDSTVGRQHPADTEVISRFYMVGSEFVDRGKKMIEWGWDCPSASFVRDNIDIMEQMPFDGVNIRIPVPYPGDEYLAKSLFYGATITYAMVQSEAQALQQTNFNRFTDNLLELRTSSSPTTVEWFDDFNSVTNNFTLAAKIAHEGGLRGFMIDVEHYGLNTMFNYGDRKYPGKSWAEYEAQVFLRGQQIMQAINAEFPDPVILFPFAYSLPYSSAQTRAGLPSAGYGLLAPFLDGMVSAASINTRLVEVYEWSYTYRTESQFVSAAATQRNAVEALALDPDRALEKFGFGFGLWPRNETSQSWENGVTFALQYADKYVWVYSEHEKWWNTPHMSGYPFMPQYIIDSQQQAHPLQVLNESLESAVKNQSYQEQLKACAGVPPYTWNIVSGMLPGGITLNSSTGELSGTPTATGSSAFMVQVTDNNSNTAEKSLSIEVIPVFTRILPAVKIEWDSVAGEEYQMQWSADGVSNWQTISHTITGNGDVNTLYDHGDTSSRPDPWLQSPQRGFYRLVLLP